MMEGFVDALNQAERELREQGIDQVEQISKQIMEKGGIKVEKNGI